MRDLKVGVGSVGIQRVYCYYGVEGLNEVGGDCCGYLVGLGSGYKGRFGNF